MEEYIPMNGNRDLRGERFGVVMNKSDDEGSADKGINAREMALHIGQRVRDVFSGSGATLHNETIVRYPVPHGKESRNARQLNSIVSSARWGAEEVERILNEGKRVLSLGGNHVRGFDVIGAMRYCHEQGVELGLIWVDAHPDLNTPETTPSGNVHGMVSAVLTGRGPKELIDLLRGAPFIKPENIIYVGLNDIDDQEDLDYTERSYLEELKSMGVKAFEMEEIRNKDNKDKMPQPVLDAVTDLGQRLEAKGGKLWVELDVDVFRVEDMPAAVMDNKDGMRATQGYDLFRHIGNTMHPIGMGVSELSPQKDPDGVGAEIVARCIGHTMGVNTLLHDELAKRGSDRVNEFRKDTEERIVVCSGGRYLYKRPGFEYVDAHDGLYPTALVKDGVVHEIKAFNEYDPDYKVGARVQIRPDYVDRFGSRSGTITKIVLPNTEGRTNDIIKIQFDDGSSLFLKTHEIIPEEAIANAA